MKILLFSLLFICNLSYSQVSEKSVFKNKYIGVKPKMPDVTQIITTTPQYLQKKIFTKVNPSNTLQVVEQNKKTAKPQFEKVLPAQEPIKLEN